ncbi:hypothetical protein [Nocardia sp. NPDC050717]
MSTRRETSAQVATIEDFLAGGARRVRCIVHFDKDWQHITEIEECRHD